MNTQLWIPSQDLHKLGPSTLKMWGRFMKPHCRVMKEACCWHGHHHVKDPNTSSQWEWWTLSLVRLWGMAKPSSGVPVQIIDKCVQKLVTVAFSSQMFLVWDCWPTRTSHWEELISCPVLYTINMLRFWVVVVMCAVPSVCVYPIWPLHFYICVCVSVLSSFSCHYQSGFQDQAVSVKVPNPSLRSYLLLMVTREKESFFQWYSHL